MQTNIITNRGGIQPPIGETGRTEPVPPTSNTGALSTQPHQSPNYVKHRDETMGLSDVPNLNSQPIPIETTPKNGVTPIRSMAEFLKTTTDVEAIELYKTDAKVIRVSTIERDGNNGAKRGKATKISRKSLENLNFLMQNTHTQFHSIITLTVPEDYPTDGKAFKKMLNAFLTWLRREFDKPSYVWIIEFQKRGAPHYHILTSVNLADYEGGLEPMKRGGYRRRAHNYMTNHDLHYDASLEWNNILFENKYWNPKEQDREKGLRAGVEWEAIRKQDGAARYISMYACKPHQKQIPPDYQNIGRAWGASRDVKAHCQPITKIKGNEFIQMDLLAKAEWIGNDFVRRAGYLPKVLYGVGKLLLIELTKEVDEVLQIITSGEIEEPYTTGQDEAIIYQPHAQLMHDLYYENLYYASFDVYE